MRRMIGLLIEWFLGYEHVVIMDSKVSCSPKHGYPGDAGYDLYSEGRVPILPGQTVEVPAGVRIDPQSQIWFEVKARSSTMKKRGLEVVDAVIDRDYRGDLLAVVHNPGGVPVAIEAGDRVVQIIPHRLIPIRFVEGELSNSSRGANGFGSTGA